MDMFIVQGGTPLSGRVAVGGAKNAALPLMAAALMAEGVSVLHNVPRLVDVTTLMQLLRSLGLRAEWRGDLLELEVHDTAPCVAEYDLVRRMRASVCVLGPLLARRGRARVSLPGGCAIGDRPIDLHLKGLRALGADVRVEHGYVVAQAKRLRGAAIYLGGPFGSTVTGTCNVMAAATLADGMTTIESAACEPEVVDLGRFLVKMGAKIEGLGTPFLRIEGVDRLHAAEHTVIPDRIEAATLMLATAITRGRVELENVPIADLTAVIEKLREVGVRVEDGSRVDGTGESWRVDPAESNSLRPRQRTPEAVYTVPSVEYSVLTSQCSVPSTLNSQRSTLVTHSPLTTHHSHLTITASERPRAADVFALPYPGIPTDVQAQFMALLTVADGISVVTDKVFPDRFLHAAELVRLGARIRREGPSALVSGVERLSGACVMASDLRASAALVLAGLAAEGETIIRRVYHVDRGYEHLESKLNQLGANVRRVRD